MEADMALYPCDYCGQRYRGPQQTAYPAIVNGVASKSRRMRLCPDDFEGVTKLEWLRSADLEPESAPSAECMSCGQDEAVFTAFVTYYATGKERADLYGRLCAACGGKPAQDALFGLSQPQERA